MRQTGSDLQIEAKLRALREKRGLSQAQAARLAGVSRPYLAKIESGRTTSIGLKTLIRVVSGLGGRLRIGVEAAPVGPRTGGRRKAAVPPFPLRRCSLRSGATSSHRRRDAAPSAEAEGTRRLRRRPARPRTSQLGELRSASA